jgi:hypothetical protein
MLEISAMLQDGCSWQKCDRRNDGTHKRRISAAKPYLDLGMIRQSELSAVLSRSTRFFSQLSLLMIEALAAGLRRFKSSPAIMFMRGRYSRTRRLN